MISNLIDQAVVEAWDAAPTWQLHPTREHENESAYWRSGATQAELIHDLLPLSDGCTILDFGCGDGRVAVALADLGYRVIGVDSSQRVLDEIIDERITTVCSDGTDLHIDPPVDAVVCLAVLIHYDYESGRALMAALASALRPGGLLVLDAPSSDEPVDNGGWLGVTTWDEKTRDGYLRTLGLSRIKAPSIPWVVYRKRRSRNG